MPLVYILFYFSPLAGIISLLWIMLRRIDRVSWSSMRGLALLLSLFLGMINTTKEAYGDFLAYQEIYTEALNASYLDYLILNAKEPIYYTFSWIICRLTQANWPVFVTFFTTVSYMAMYEAVLLMAKRIGCSKLHVMAVLVFSSFFFQTFAMNGNMLRQSISQSFALLFLAHLYFTGHYRWIYAILSLGIHTASLPIIGLGIIPFVRRPLTPKRLLLLCASVLVLAVLFMSMSGILSKVMFIGYIFVRLDATSQLTGTDSWQTTVGFNAQFYILSFLLLAMIGYIYYTYYHRSELDGKQHPLGIIAMTNIVLILIILLFVCNFAEAYYLCVRYQFFVYTFQTALLLLFLHTLKGRAVYMTELAVCLLMFPYFCYYYSNGTFKYAPLTDILITPPILYFVKI